MVTGRLSNGDKCCGIVGDHDIVHCDRPTSSERPFRRGETYVGFAWVLRVRRDAGHEHLQRFAAAESVAPACELRENSDTLKTIRIKHGEARI